MPLCRYHHRKLVSAIIWGCEAPRLFAVGVPYVGHYFVKHKVRVLLYGANIGAKTHKKGNFRGRLGRLTCKMKNRDKKILALLNMILTSDEEHAWIRR